MSETIRHCPPLSLPRPNRCAVAAALLLGAAAASAGEGTGEIGLDAAVEAARAAAPALLAERQRLAAAEADRSAATGALLPRVQASGTWTWLDDGRLGATGPLPLYAEERLATLRGRQVLFDWRAFSGRLAAGRTADAAGAAVAAAEGDAVLGATIGWVRLAQAEELARVTAAALARARAFEEMSAAFATAGRGSNLDPLRARSSRLEAERTALAAREAVPVAGARLGQVIGRGAGAALRTDGRWPEAVAPPSDDGALLARALGASPDLARADALASAARAAASGARGTWLPEVAAVATWGWRERDVGGSADEWTAGVTLDWTLFEGGAGRAGTARADARLAELEAVRRGLRLQLEGDVLEALAAWRTAAAGLAAAREGLAAANEARDTATALFRSGRATSVDVLGAEADLQRAEAAVIGALGDLVTARARALRLGAA
jgi:outer membrane protein TolC